MVTKTANLELTEVEDADVGPGASASFNSSYDRLDALVQLSVKSRVLTAAPAAPPQGTRYIVPSTGVASTDPWYLFPNRIAYFSATGWLFLTPRPGWEAVIEDESSGSPQVIARAVYVGTTWLDAIQDGNPLTTKGDLITRDSSDLTRLPVGSDYSVLMGLAAASRGLQWTKLLTTKGGLLAYSGTAPVELLIGTNGQLLSADSTAAAGFSWKSLLGTKGDVLGFGTALGILSVGADGTVLTADSASTLGFKWATAGGGGGGGSLPAPPASVPGLVIWMDASILPFSSASQLPAIPNPNPQFVPGFYEAINSAGASPTGAKVGATPQNGHPVIDCSAGSNDTSYLITNGYGLAKGFTYFAVLNPLAIVIGDIVGGAANAVNIQTSSTRQISITQAQVAVKATSTGTMAANTWQQVNCTWSGAGAYAFRIAKTAAGSGTASAFTSFSVGSTSLFYNGGVAANYFAGLIAELLVYQRVLSGTEITAIESYLSAKWSV